MLHLLSVLDNFIMPDRHPVHNLFWAKYICHRFPSNPAVLMESDQINLPAGRNFDQAIRVVEAVL